MSQSPVASVQSSDPNTLGALLGGRVAYRQPRSGYRTGIEPVLLAASIPAVAGDRVVEAGTGAGAGLLCLMARVPGLEGYGIERDPPMASLARTNLESNGFGNVSIATEDILAWRGAASYRHAFANPPWHHGGTASPDRARDAAKRGRPGLLHDWALALASGLCRRGTLSLITPAAASAEALAALAAARCEELTLIPLWPHAGEPARLAIVRGVRDGKGGTTLHPGLVLHGADGRYTTETDAILRNGGGLAS